MRNGKHWLAMATILGSSFLGGVVSHWLLSNDNEATADETRPGARIVRASAFVLTGGDRQMRGAFRISPGGLPELVLQDSSGATRARLALMRDGSQVQTLVDRAGGSRASLRFSPSGSPWLSLRDPSGKVIWEVRGGRRRGRWQDGDLEQP